jgi:CHASE3 domain sensor protein
MNKSSYIKLFLTLALSLNLLGGCEFPQEFETQNNTSGTKDQVKKSEKTNQEQLKKRVEEIDIAYKTYLESQNKFIESFNQQGFNPDAIPETVNTKDSYEKLLQLNQAITQLQNEIKPLQTTESNTISNIISDIEKLIQDLFNKVISPLENGLTKDAVGKVQVGLGVLTGQDTSGKGKFGPITSSGVENFLTDKSQNITEKISQLKQAINSTSSTTSTTSTTSISQGDSSSDFQRLEKEFNRFKREANERAKQQDSRIFFWIGSQLITTVLFIFIFIFLLIIWLRHNKKPRRNHQNKITSGVSSQESEDQVIDRYQELEVKYKYLETRLKQLEQHYQNFLTQYIINPSQSTEDKGITDLHHPSQTLRHSSPQRTRNYQESPLNKPQSALTNTNLSSIESQLIQEYNSNHKALSKKVIEVNVREDSLNKNRMGSNQPIALEPTRNGSYWVCESGGVGYLIPKHKLTINQFNVATIQDLFNCDGYSSNFQGFKLLKPAQVYSSDGGKKWQVSQLGILRFD